jgi:hypothetical protein
LANLTNYRTINTVLVKLRLTNYRKINTVLVNLREQYVSFESLPQLSNSAIGLASWLGGGPRTGQDQWPGEVYEHIFCIPCYEAPSWIS